MHRRKPLATLSDVQYLYDGGLMGLYTCVHACVYSGQLPLDIQPEHLAAPTLLSTRFIQTDEEKAARVRGAIARKISPRALELCETVFLSCLEQKEIKTLRFLLLAFEEGPGVLSMLHHPAVATMLKAERHLLGEAHLLLGFIRFSDHDGVLVSTIQPKNFALPFIADHFIDRFPQETFMIYDKTHGAALIYEKGRSQIVELAEMAAFAVSDEEAQYRSLWKQFYNTLAIEARYNPKCRMTHMPKRYWAEMTEMRELL